MLMDPPKALGSANQDDSDDETEDTDRDDGGRRSRDRGPNSRRSL